MKTWNQAFTDAVATGSAASVSSTVALARRLGSRGRPSGGRRQQHQPLALGRRGGEDERRVDSSTPAVGYATHHASAYFWAVLHERWVGEWAEQSGAGGA